MYNRYIPQADGSYRRNRMAEPTKPQPAPPSPVPEPEEHQPQQPPKPPIVVPKQPDRQPPHTANAGDFLRQLLPKNLDTGDLLIIVLLLLMSADCQEDRNSALLTLALYLIM